ncbi:hypothetical protein EI555_020976, partial [Monodon monoceros]
AVQGLYQTPLRGIASRVEQHGGCACAAWGAELCCGRVLRSCCGSPESLQAQLERGVPGLELDLSLSHNRSSVIGLLRWKALLAQMGRKPAPAPATPRPQAGLAVYASPENEKPFQEENLLRQEGRVEKIQTKASEATKSWCCGHPTCVKVTRKAHRTEGRILMVLVSVVNFERPKTKIYKYWLAP